VDGCDSVDGVTADNAEMRHVDTSLAPLLDTRHSTLPLVVAWPAILHFLPHNHRPPAARLAALPRS